VIDRCGNLEVFRRFYLCKEYLKSDRFLLLPRRTIMSVFSARLAAIKEYGAKAIMNKSDYEFIHKGADL